MSRTFILLALVLACGCSGSETGKKNNKNKPSDNHLHLLVENIMHDLSKPNKSKFHDSFIEEFDQNRSTFFTHHSGGKGADFTWEMRSVSSSEPDTRILALKLDPEDEAGAGKGAELVSNKFTFYGTYAARLKVPDPRDVQPNVGAVVGYFTYREDNEYGLSEIDFEWLIADPQIIYVGTWTGPSGKLKRIGRIINLAQGQIYETIFREHDGSNRRILTGDQNQPETIKPIQGYDASSQFHTYGFDWYPDRIRWWMLHPATNDTIVLWDYRGSDIGIPTTYTRYRINIWHTDDWPVHTNPNSIEKPLFPFGAEVDWMSYNPFETH